MEIGRLGVGASVKGLLVGLVLCAGALAWKHLLSNLDRDNSALPIDCQYEQGSGRTFTGHHSPP